MAAILTVIALDSASPGGVQSFGRGDAATYRAVAADIDGSDIGPGEGSYRYGRIGYPLLGWLAAGGDQGRVPVALAAVNVLAGAVAAFAVARFSQLAGRSPLFGLAVLGLVGITRGAQAWISEPVTIAAVGIFLLSIVQDRPWPAALAGSLAVLTREASLVVVMPAALWVVLSRRRVSPVLVAPVAAMSSWSAWVWLRTGEVPVLSSSGNKEGATSWPFTGPIKALEDGAILDQELELAVAVAVYLCALAAVALAVKGSGHDALRASLLAAGLFVPLLGRTVFATPGDALRVTGVLQMLLLIALVSGDGRVEPDRTETSVATPSASWNGAS